MSLWVIDIKKCERAAVLRGHELPRLQALLGMVSDFEPPLDFRDETVVVGGVHGLGAKYV
jgi:hypothetical protein